MKAKRYPYEKKTKNLMHRARADFPAASTARNIFKCFGQRNIAAVPQLAQSALQSDLLAQIVLIANAHNSQPIDNKIGKKFDASR